MELKKYKLGDVADIVNGATPSTHNSENYDGSIIWITPKDLSGQKQKIIRRGQRNISEIGFNNCSAQMIPPYNILMSSRAPIGLLAINENECCTNQGFKNLVLDKSICDTDYMYYYLQFHMKEIEALGSGTTFKEISKSALQGIEIRLPNLEKQRDIAKCLSDLDRKIELNKQINDNLRLRLGIAQTAFGSALGLHVNYHLSVFYAKHNQPYLCPKKARYERFFIYSLNIRCHHPRC